MEDSVCSGEIPVRDIRNVSIYLILDQLVSTHLEEILTYTVFAVIAVVGFIANVLFLFVVYGEKKLHTVMNAYLVNLAVADAIILSYGYTERVYFYASSPVSIGSSFLGPLFCIANTLYEFTGYVSLLLVTLFSMERYFAICHPIRHMRIRSAKRTTIILATVWILSFILAASQIPATGRRESLCIIFPDELSDLNGDHHRCRPYAPNYATYFRPAIHQFPFYAAMIGSCYFYVSIILKLRSRQDAMSGGDDQMEATMAKARVAATRMIIINGCVFFLCSAPLYFYITINWILGIAGHQLNISSETNTKLVLVMTMMIYLNSAINPFIYSATNRQYRKAFRKLLLCAREDSSQSRPGTSTTLTTSAL